MPSTSAGSNDALVEQTHRSKAALRGGPLDYAKSGAVRARGRPDPRPRGCTEIQARRAAPVFAPQGARPGPAPKEGRLAGAETRSRRARPSRRGSLLPDPRRLAVSIVSAARTHRTREGARCGTLGIDVITVRETSPRSAKSLPRCKLGVAPVTPATLSLRTPRINRRRRSFPKPHPRTGRPPSSG